MHTHWIYRNLNCLRNHSNPRNHVWLISRARDLKLSWISETTNTILSGKEVSEIVVKDNDNLPVQAIDNFVYMMTSSKWRPGTILEKLYPPQNFVPAFLSTVVWSLESQFP